MKRYDRCLWFVGSEGGSGGVLAVLMVSWLLILIVVDRTATTADAFSVVVVRTVPHHQSTGPHLLRSSHSSLLRHRRRSCRSGAPSTPYYDQIPAPPGVQALYAIRKNDNNDKWRWWERTFRASLGRLASTLSDQRTKVSRWIHRRYDILRNHITTKEEQSAATSDSNFESLRSTAASTIASGIEADHEAVCSSVEQAQPRRPEGPRWAIASTDLSGTWKPVVTPEFLQQYDVYLQHCGEGLLWRKALLSTIGLSQEVYEQRNDGRELSITSVTPIRKWGRILLASGADLDTSDYEPMYSEFPDPDGDTVQVEAWWEDEGTKHKSFLRNKPLVRGGTIETTRYLHPNDADILVCESTFHPPPDNSDPKFQQDSVEWTFRRIKDPRLTSYIVALPKSEHFFKF